MDLARALKLESTMTATNADAREAVIKALVARKQGFDLCFLLDATASMQEYMDMVKIRVAEMVNGVKVAYPRYTVRVAVVLYSDDDCHDQNGYEVRDFTMDINGSQLTFVQFLSSVCARSGWLPDYPEDVFTGLEMVAKLGWQAASRVMVHICDAPCHGFQFHDLYISMGVGCDKYPQGDLYGRDIAHILQQLRGPCQISQYFCCHVTDYTKKDDSGVQESDWKRWVDYR